MVRFDATGKVSLDHIYTQPDPRAYFSALRDLDYQIPQLAKPHFTALIDEYRAQQRVEVPQIVDVGSSYGINAALLRCDVTMDHLYERYAGLDADELTRAELQSRDRALVRATSGVRARFLGLDISLAALHYGHEVGFLDDVMLADLEREDPTPMQRAMLAGTDLVISTGCLGYVSGTTLARVIEASGGRPWMAHFVLRMFPFESIEAAFSDFGYRTERVPGMFRQRRFISAEEQAQVLDTLISVGVDPSGLESDGWLYAQLYLSRPILTSTK